MVPGTPTELLKVLASYAPANATNKKNWPQAPNIFSNRLRRVQSFLREKGIEVERSKSGPRSITLTTTGNTEPAQTLEREQGKFKVEVKKLLDELAEKEGGDRPLPPNTLVRDDCTNF